jgi:hypothetical protein
MLHSSQTWLLILKLERHITRHRQKDEEAGAEGCGILNTRKVNSHLQKIEIHVLIRRLGFLAHVERS